MLIAGTTGTKVSQLYHKALTSAGVPFIETTEHQQALLMDAIYEGIKVADFEKAEHCGRDLIHSLLKGDNCNPTTILAGCTEVPEIWALLLKSDDIVARQFVQRTTLVDPAQLAVDSVLTQIAVQNMNCMSCSSLQIGVDRQNKNRILCENQKAEPVNIGAKSDTSKKQLPLFSNERKKPPDTMIMMMGMEEWPRTQASVFSVLCILLWFFCCALPMFHSHFH
jgi:hypothetical protein